MKSATSWKHLPAIALAMVWLGAHAVENPSASREYQLKTAYLYHFAELAEWPEARDIRICASSGGALSRYVLILEGRRIADQVVHVSLTNGGDIDHCQIVYLGADEALTSELLDQARRKHVLLVGDGEGFAASGGMLQFSLRDNKLKLLVNLASVKAAELKLSSKLLRMAELVE